MSYPTSFDNESQRSIRHPHLQLLCVAIATMYITDARGKAHPTDRPPTCVVSLVPSLTELLSSLQLDEETVGITRFCEHPSTWKDTKMIVGGTKNVRTDRVRSLNPDLVLANLEENKKETVEEIDQFARVYVSLVDDLKAAIDMITDVGLLTHKEDLATSLSVLINRRFQLLPSYPRLRAAYLIWKDPWMTVGGDTFIDSMMKRAGFENVFSNSTRYPSITLGDIRDRNPQVILLSSEPFPFDHDHREQLQKQLDDSYVLCVRGDLFSWYGSRLLESPSYFRTLRSRLKAKL